MKTRLDLAMVQRGLVPTRSQAESYIKLSQVMVDGHVVTKPGVTISPDNMVTLLATEQYVSRAALKLASVTKILGINFSDKVVLDIGSSTGGFTQYALRHGATQVIAVDVGTNQLHPRLRTDQRITLFEQTDIRDLRQLPAQPDIILADVSFISLREILPHASRLGNDAAQYVVMVKPQFEAGESLKHKGVIKNDTIRRQILKDFEAWTQKFFVIRAKADSDITGAQGNRERFYLLTSLKA